LKGYPGEKAIILTALSFNPTYSVGGGGAYHTVERLEVSGGGISIQTRGVVIRGNHIHDVSNRCDYNPAGVVLDNSSSEGIIENNVIHDNYDHTANGYEDVPRIAGFAENCANIKIMHNTSGHIV